VYLRPNTHQPAFLRSTEQPPPKVSYTNIRYAGSERTNEGNEKEPSARVADGRRRRNVVEANQGDVAEHSVRAVDLHNLLYSRFRDVLVLSRSRSLIILFINNK
jgi:hypothetical protein